MTLHESSDVYAEFSMKIRICIPKLHGTSPLARSFFYYKNGQPVLVRLSLADFNAFYGELKRLSAEAKKRESSKKALK